MTGTADIIVVDDEPDLRLMLEDYLSMQGFRVRQAADGAELDQRLAEGPADLLVLDVNMPGEDGFAIAHRLREGGSRAGILMLTAAGDVPSRVRGLDGGADEGDVDPGIVLHGCPSMMLGADPFGPRIAITPGDSRPAGLPGVGLLYRPR